MDDPRLVALGLVPPPPGQEKAPEAESWTAAPEAPPVTSDWQPTQQSQYLPTPPNPFSEAANTIPQYPDPFTTPLPPVTPPTPPAPQQPAVPSIFNSPNSPFSFAPGAAAPAAPAREYTTAPDYKSSAPTPATYTAPSPFTAANAPFGVATAPTTFTPAAPVAAPTTKEGKKAALRAIEEAKKAAKIAEENAEKAAKIAEEDAKRNAKLAAAQAKIDEREAKIAEREAKKAAEREAKQAKRAKLLAPEVTPTAPFVAAPFAPPAPASVAQPAPTRFAPQAATPFSPAAVAIPAQPQKTPPYVELMNAIGKHPAVIRKDVQYGYFGRARLELSPMGFALVGLRTGTAYTWNEVKEIKASRGRLEIKTEADRERVVKTKEATTTQPYVEKLTRALVISIDGATEPGFAPYIAKVMQDMKAQTFNYHATSWLEYENALERVRGEFSEHDDPFVPAVAGALFAFIFVAGLFILPEIVNLASDIKPPAGAFVVQPRYGWFDVRSFVMAVGLSALLTRLVLRLGLGSSALSWARGSVRGWHTSGPLALRIATRELARLLLGTSFAAAALFLGFSAFAPTVASTLVIDSVGLREVVPLPIIGVDKKWSEVNDVQKSEGPGRLEGFGVTVFFRDGRWVTTVDHDLSGGTDGQLLQRATSWWKTATE
jgi:hypothetical protein